MPCRLGAEASSPLFTPTPPPVSAWGPGLAYLLLKDVLHWFSEYSMQRPN